MKFGADLNCKDDEENTPLLWAASTGNLYILRRLVEAGVNKYSVNHDQLNVMHTAASNGYIDIVLYLIPQCPGRKLLDGKDKNGDTPLFYACAHGHYEVCVALLQNEANPNHVVSKSSITTLIIYCKI